MIDLYFAPTANGLRASLVLEETGLAYRLHKIDLMKGEQRSAEFLKLNPAGLIPVIVDSDGPGGKPLTLSQSGAIVLYCAEKSGKFLPRDARQRAIAMQWFMQAASDIAGTSGTIFRLEVTAPEKSTANVEYFKKRLLDFFAVCDEALEGREYLAGELSVADLMLYPNFAARKALIDQAGGFANLQRWGATMAARPAVARGMNPS
ncbi:MAG TPA: glutathione S-transferase N-terminal domain-containing protein [Burkholderiales bacterium]|nr:glutathione S-transferase N-terminal domain-containing protein [Burkholderiales bacterium]